MSMRIARMTWLDRRTLDSNVLTPAAGTQNQHRLSERLRTICNESRVVSVRDLDAQDREFTLILRFHA
jgi:hypothetical protein